MAKRILIVLGVAAAVCGPVAASAADIMPCKKIKLQCRGFEPSWSFVLPGNGTIRFTDPENPNFQTAPIVIAACAQKLPGQRIVIHAGAPLSLAASVKPQPCTEASGDMRPFFVDISYIQGAQSNSPHPASGNGC